MSDSDAKRQILPASLMRFGGDRQGNGLVASLAQIYDNSQWDRRAYVVTWL
jgi:hypothetical protein